jgi:hypothetical protein
MDSEVSFTNLLRCNHHWPFCHVLTLTRLTLMNLTLIPIIMRNLTILFPVTGHDDIVDVSVVEGAVRRGDAVVTSNMTHIRMVADATGARLRIESI